MLMFSITSFLLGLLAVGIGVITLKFNYQLVGITGHAGWIESRLGAGTTYFAYKMFSILLIIGGILYAFGLFDDLLYWALSPIADFLPKVF